MSFSSPPDAGAVARQKAAKLKAKRIKLTGRPQQAHDRPQWPLTLSHLHSAHECAVDGGAHLLPCHLARLELVVVRLQ